MNVNFERYAYSLTLFVVGVALLGHGMAATVFIEGVTPATIVLPLVGSAVAYRSLVGLLPPESSLSANAFLVLLATLTAGFVNLVVPVVYASANVLPGVETAPGYWPALVVGVTGFTALGVYELLADRIGEQYLLAKLLVVALVAIVIGLGLLRSSGQSLANVASVHPIVGFGGAVFAAALTDYARRAKREKRAKRAEVEQSAQ